MMVSESNEVESGEIRPKLQRWVQHREFLDKEEVA